MANHQLHPLKVNPLTGEPFLTLRNHPNIILTPPRPEDVALWPPIMNDPRIYEWLGNPPIPYLASHAEEWYEKIKDMSDASLSALEAARDASEPILVEHSPVRAIREVNEDGSDTYLGDIGLIRAKEGKFLVSPNEYENEEKKTQCLADNNALPLGDPNIVWSFGDYLIPSHHGRGIMTDVMQTLLLDWAVPRMGVRHVISSAFEGNEGSLRVFQKNGFVRTRFIENHVETRGTWRNLHVLEWKWLDSRN